MSLGDREVKQSPVYLTLGAQTAEKSSWNIAQHYGYLFLYNYFTGHTVIITGYPVEYKVWCEIRRDAFEIMCNNCTS